jgi:hypothetical protein
MVKRAAAALYVVVMIGLVVGVDVLFLRHLLWERLVVNIGIVLVFAALYMRFLRRPRLQLARCRCVSSAVAD